VCGSLEHPRHRPERFQNRIRYSIGPWRRQHST